MMGRDELSRFILISLLKDIVSTQNELKRIEKHKNRHLKTNTRLRAAYDAFERNGGGTIGELEAWLASYRPLPAISTKKHMRLVVDQDHHAA